MQARVGGYIQVRSDQNQLWASGSVARGVALAKAGRTAQAIAAYEYAIELDRTHADAYVARGAAYASTERYHQALSDFERCAVLLSSVVAAHQHPLYLYLC